MPTKNKLVQLALGNRQKISSAELSRRKEQSKRDRSRAVGNGNYFNSETLRVLKRDSKSPDEMLSMRVIDLDGLNTFLESVNHKVDTLGKRPVVEVRKLQVEMVNASSKGIAMGEVSIDNIDTKRSLLVANGKAVLNFNPFSSLNGNTVIYLGVPQFAGTGEVWFILKYSCSVRYVY